MPVEACTHPGTIGGFSGRLWQYVRHDAIRNGVINGFVKEIRFGEFKPTSNFNAAEAYWDQGMLAFGSDGASAVYFAGVGDDNGMTFASDGDNEGVGIRHQLVPVRLSRADKAFAWELVFETSTITDTKNGFLVGLMDNAASTATSPIAAAGTLADRNFVGFHRLEGDGDKLDLVYKADGVTQVTTLPDAITLVADTEYRIGMTYLPNGDPFTESKYVLRWWLNGERITTGTSHKVIPSADGTDFPNDVAMGANFNLLNATGSTPGNITLKRFRYAQEF